MNTFDPFDMRQTFDPADLKDVLGTMVCPRMLRAWRNRSNVTRAAWQRAAFKLTGDHDNGGALYTACAEFCNPPTWTFDGTAPYLTRVYWQSLAARLPGFLASPPEKALSRYQWEQRNPLTSRLHMV